LCLYYLCLGKNASDSKYSNMQESFEGALEATIR
jgi:hypothetical protein